MAPIIPFTEVLLPGGGGGALTIGTPGSINIVVELTGRRAGSPMLDQQQANGAVALFDPQLERMFGEYASRTVTVSGLQAARIREQGFVILSYGHALIEQVPLKAASRQDLSTLHSRTAFPRSS